MLENQNKTTRSAEKLPFHFIFYYPKANITQLFFINGKKNNNNNMILNVSKLWKKCQRTYCLQISCFVRATVQNSTSKSWEASTCQCSFILEKGHSDDSFCGNLATNLPLTDFVVNQINTYMGYCFFTFLLITKEAKTVLKRRSSCVSPVKY